MDHVKHGGYNWGSTRFLAFEFRLKQPQVASGRRTDGTLSSGLNSTPMEKSGCSGLGSETVRWESWAPVVLGFLLPDSEDPLCSVRKLTPHLAHSLPHACPHPSTMTVSFLKTVSQNAKGGSITGKCITGKCPDRSVVTKRKKMVFHIIAGRFCFSPPNLCRTYWKWERWHQGCATVHRWPRPRASAQPGAVIRVMFMKWPHSIN